MKTFIKNFQGQKITVVGKVTFLGDKIVGAGRWDLDKNSKEFDYTAQDVAKVIAAINKPIIRPVVEYKTAGNFKKVWQRPSKAKQYDDMYNEGGEGYNPHRA